MREKIARYKVLNSSATWTGVASNKQSKLLKRNDISYMLSNTSIFLIHYSLTGETYQTGPKY